MTTLTMKLKADILALLELVQKKQAAAGEPWSDSKASLLCFKHGEYVGNLRKWNGGTGGPTLQKTLEFEDFLALNLGEKEYEKFLKSRARITPAAPAVEDDFGE